MHPARLLALPVIVLLACGPRRLETTVMGRKTQSLVALAEKQEGRWQVSLRLPAGNWSVSAPQEPQAVEVVPGSPFATARWTVSPERWRNTDRPLLLNLCSPEGQTLEFSITYAPMGPGSMYWLSALIRSGVMLRP